MTAAMIAEVLGVLGRVEHLEDRELFRQRQRVVAAIGLDEVTIVARVKSLQVMRVGFVGSRFDVDLQGVEPTPAAVIGALDESERLLDLIAWPLAAPARLATLLGRVAMLGEHQLDDFAPLGHRIAVHRSAVSWLLAGCVGVVPIDPRRAARRFLDVDGELVAEDVEHARELAAARVALVDMSPAILIPEKKRAAA